MKFSVHRVLLDNPTTQGLPRVEELFEARTPKKPAVISEKKGIVNVYAGETENTSEVSITSEDNGEVTRYPIPFGMRLCVASGDTVDVGDALTEGNKAPSDIMRILGLDAVYEYVIKEIQKVYRSQSCNVNDKHIEIIARQMTRKIRVSDSGDTDMLVGSLVDMTEFEEETNKILARIDAGEDAKLPEGAPELLGITKASLQTESFLSAASFQETTRVLTEAAIKGKVDHLLGLKENVIIGKLIPAGTGMDIYNKVDVVKTEESDATETA